MVRKKFSKRLLAMAAALCLIVCMMPAGAKASEADTVKYVALGDSITRGYGLGAPETEAFPALISAEKRYSLINHGADGATSENLLVSLEDPQTAEDVESADVITITIGGNDLMGALYSYIADAWNTANPNETKKGEEDIKTAFEEKDLSMLTFALGVIDGFAKSSVAGQAVSDFTKNFGQIIAAVRAANPDVLLFVATQYNPYKWLPDQCTDKYHDDVVKIADAFDTGVSVLNSVIASGAESGAYVAVGVYDAFNASDVNLSKAKYSSTSLGPVVIPSVDLDFHPNTEGHQVIAEAVEKSIDTTVQNAFAKAISVVEALGTITVDQKDITSLETAQAWAVNQIQSLPAAGLNVTGALDQFVPAVAGTAENPAGTNGAFNIVATLELAGQSQNITIPVVIKATAYTAPAQDEDKDDNKADAGDNKDESKDENKQETQSAQVTTDKEKTEKDTVEAPATGDSAVFMPYVVLLLAAVAAAAAAGLVRRKMFVR